MKKIILSLLLLLCMVTVTFAKDEGPSQEEQEIIETIRQLDRTVSSQYQSAIDQMKRWEAINTEALLKYAALQTTLSGLQETIKTIDPKHLGGYEPSFMTSGFMAQLSANWMVTKGILFGFVNLDKMGEVVDSWVTMESGPFGTTRVKSVKEDTPPDLIVKACKLAEEQMKATTPQDINITVTNDIPETAQEPIKSLITSAKYMENLKNIPGIDATKGSIYKLSLLVARLLWCVIFVIFLAWSAYKMLISGENIDMITVVFKGMFVFLSLYFVRTFAILGIDISTAVGDAILGGTDVAHAVSDIAKIVESKQSVVSTGGIISGAIAELVLKLCAVIAEAVVFVMFILADIMMAISIVIGPWMIVLSMLPFCQDWTAHWIKSYVTFLFYRPLACLLCVLLYIVGLTGVDVGLVELMIICIIFIITAVKVPSMAENMSGAAAAVGAGIAGMVGKAARVGGGLAAGGAGHGVAALAGKALGKMKSVVWK